MTRRGFAAIKERTMNQNQVKGTAKDIAGKAQEKFGDVTDNATQQAKGMAKQVEGKVQKGVGNAQDAADDAADRVASDRANRPSQDRR
jgi:uncharacterized protein YjbJ (UPF0337 family)